MRTTGRTTERTAGYTIVEMLVVLVVVGIVAAGGVFGLLNLMASSAVEQAGQVVAQQFALAKNSARRDNRDVTITVDPVANELTVKRSTTVLSRAKFVGVTATVTCRTGNCPAGNAFTLRAPFGTLAQDVKVQVARGAFTRSTYILGPVMVVVRR